MHSGRLRGALASILDRVDGGARPLARGPSPEEDGTRAPRSSWDLRTLIAVFGPDDPFRHLNVNVALGLTGLPFDRTETWRGRDADLAADLQLCLEGRDRAVTYKRYHAIGEDVSFAPGRVLIEHLDRVRFEGTWPRFEIRWRQPEDGLELDLEFDASAEVQRWAWSPRIYGHYTTFGACRMRWRLEGREGEVSCPALLDHGFGRRLARRLSPLSRFRYEVMRLGDGDVAVGMWTEAPGGLALRSAGVVRPAGGPILATRYACAVGATDSFANFRGRECQVPRTWTGRLVSDRGTLTYRARRTTPPRAVLGDGFLYGFELEGEGTGAFGRTLSGQGYAEQMGPAWANDRRTPRTAPG